ncbi:hypothetical protein Acid345_0745 [Candidatus Koribacter versatilis Ellin345]|uniref:Doubled CXXCH motif domain-containing protein n=1 Tax=Koribacter versatilis (strain Ellin345) TaxID=204669 RepID=Q1ITQ0_KORVE|nr:hypothetical protein [Candidatus Koribacter versatilis]ABF39750.1 hypothetical protein Acid345_0745 [Candidatus Koribacter versatilis Ellin345]
MKKVFMLILCVTFFVGMAAAQTYNAGTGLTGIDILGAHNDGGRGCAGCHAPHSGGRGGGGNIGNGYNGALNNDPNSGNDALFGQDLSPLYGYTLAMGDGGRYTETIPAFTAGSDEIRGIAMCLACHDGNVAKGGMMTNYAYEQRMNLLPSGIYGNAVHIPTLLGNDGSSAGNYNNDHPVGLAANFGALRLGTYLTVTFSASNAVSTITPTATASGTQYSNFLKNYGMPAIEGTSWSWGLANPEGNTNQNNLYVTCTTCHNQHVMYIYKGAGKTAGTAIQKNGYYPSYFFINAPYNPGAWNNYTNSATQAPSTTQFCRQCHFGEANEAFGVNNVTTVF